MQILPYFPEPVEVVGNVASERYRVTNGFVKRVMAGHFVSALAVASVAEFLVPSVDLDAAAWIFLGSLVALTVVRRMLDGGVMENWLGFILMLPTVWSLGTVLRHLSDSGLPVWVFGLSYLFASLYATVCGRDFSFVGQFVLTTLATVASMVVATLLGYLTWIEAVAWGALGLTFAFYYVYDLAALLSRRRLGEETAAVADLYRDMLNFLTYSVRVVLHWRRFRFI